MRLRQVVPLEQLGQPEVADPDVPVSVEHEIGGLDVAVDHLLAVGIVERVGDLGAEAGNFAEINRLGLAAERAATRPSSAARGGRGRSVDPGLDPRSRMVDRRGRC